MLAFMGAGADFIKDFYLDAHFFLEFPFQTAARVFPGFDFAAGKFPAAAVCEIWIPACDQNFAVSNNDCGGYDRHRGYNIINSYCG